MGIRVFLGACAIAGVALAVQPAAAATATFDFNAIADGATFYSTADPDTARAGFEGNWNRPDGIDGSVGAVVGDGEGIVDKATGITVYARGINSTGAVADAFFDSNNAGLGVCSYGIDKLQVRRRPARSPATTTSTATRRRWSSPSTRRCRSRN